MLNATQQQNLPRLFKIYDSDRNGHIESRDFDRLLDSLAAGPNLKAGSSGYDALQQRFTARFNHMLELVDADRDGRISQSEWLTYVDNVLQDPQAYEAEVKGVAGLVFSLFDANGDQELSLDEYNQMLTGLGLDGQGGPQMFDRLSLDRNGRISRQRFVALVDEFFRGADPNAPGAHVFGS